MRTIFPVGCCAAAGKPRAMSITPRAKLPSFRLFISPSRTVLVLCLNLGRTYTFHCRRKSKRASKWLDFLVNVPFWSALELTLNQRVRSSSNFNAPLRYATPREVDEFLLNE